MSSSTDRLVRFADLVVRVGVNVQPGQGVLIGADIAQLEVARAVVEQAYAAGAGWVDVEWTDGPIRRSQLTHGSLESLTRDRPWALQRTSEWAEEGIATIALVGEPDSSLFADVDPAKLTAVRKGEQTARRQAVMANRWRWTVVAAPNPGWAAQVYGEPDVERLWTAVAKAMRLDEADPVAAWRDRAAVLGARAKALDALEVSELTYSGDGTDLTVGLIPGCRWTGGSVTDPAGITSMPNIPTEEVFTSPDRRRADGVLRVTKPVVIAGQLVEGLRLTLEGGRITEVTADTGAEVARAQLDSDEGARSLGEVALVDKESRIAQADTVFHNTLFDENAGCHVAWGQSFPFTIPDWQDLTADQRFEAGLNTATVHTDVVVGGDGLTVTATTPTGKIPILIDDEWVLA